MTAASAAEERIGAGIVVVLGAGFVIATVGAAHPVIDESGRLGAGFMPLVAGATLCFFGLIAAVQAFRNPSRTETPKTGSVRGGPRVGILIASTAAAIMVVPIAGFVLAFGVLAFVIMSVVERERIRVAIVATLTATAALWLIFDVALGIPLLTGML